MCLFVHCLEDTCLLLIASCPPTIHLPINYLALSSPIISLSLISSKALLIIKLTPYISLHACPLIPFRKIGSFLLSLFSPLISFLIQNSTQPCLFLLVPICNCHLSLYFCFPCHIIAHCSALPLPCNSNLQLCSSFALLEFFLQRKTCPSSSPSKSYLSI